MMHNKVRFRRWIVGVMLLVLVLGSILTQLFWSQVVAAVTLPPQTNGATGTSRATMASSPTSTSVPCVLATTSSWVTLARDTFQRGNQRLWGRAVDGQMWGADANTLNVFSIVDGTGQLAQGQGIYTAILGPKTTNAEIITSGSMSRFNATSLGVVLRWQDTNNWYKASLDGTGLIIDKKVAGIVTRLGIIPFAASGGSMYTLRFLAEGTTLSVKAWLTGTSEPPSWRMTLNDSSLSSGYGGVRFVVRKRVTVNITAFTEKEIEPMERRCVS